MAVDIRVPPVVFKTRIEIDEAPGFKWYDLSANEMFGNRRVAVFGLPGAFTPTCSSTHVPTFDAYYDEICNHNIDEIYCISVNDAYVMNSWFKSLGVQKVKPVPDGSGIFARKMGFLVDKTNIGMGMRSWRYSMIVNNGVVEMIWVEPGLDDNADGDPFQVSDAHTMLTWLEANAQRS
jgi:peroxiredoxin